MLVERIRSARFATEPRLPARPCSTTDSPVRRISPTRAARRTALADEAAVARTWGDCYGYLLVATGRRELMVDNLMSPWDAAALVPVVREAAASSVTGTARYRIWQRRDGHERPPRRPVPRAARCPVATGE